MDFPKKDMTINSIGNESRNKSRFEIVLTIIRIDGSKLGLITRIRLLIKLPPAEPKQLLNQLHGSNALKRKTGYASILSGMTVWNMKVKTRNCAIGNKSDQRTPKKERLYCIIKSLLTRCHISSN